MRNPLARLLDEVPSSRELRNLLVEAACHKDVPADRARLVQHLLKNPQSKLGIPVLVRHGTLEQATELWNVWQEQELAPDGALELGSRFQLRAAKTKAWQMLNSGDWHQAVDSVLCLCNYPLDEHGSEIHKLLDEQEGKALFTEILPAMAPLVSWPDCLNRLARWSDQCSTDCLGGLVLGIALCGGKEAKAAFRQRLLSPNHEFQGEGTGLGFFSELGGRILGIQIPELATLIRECEDSLVRDHLFRVLLSWLRVRLAGRGDEIHKAPSPVSWEIVYLSCFEWGPDGNRDQSLRKLCPKDRRSDFHHLEQRVRDAVLREMMKNRE